MAQPLGLGEKLTFTPTPDNAELQTSGRTEIETEIGSKLILLHNGMNAVSLLPVDKRHTHYHRRQGLISPNRISRAVQYPVETPDYAPETKAWLESNGYSTESVTKEVTAWLETKSLRTRQGDHELGIDLMTQMAMTSPKTDLVYLKGGEKVRATALPSTANAPISTLEGLNVRDLSSYNLQQLSDINGALDSALETVFLILGEDIDLSYRQHPVGTVAVGAVVSLPDMIPDVSLPELLDQKASKYAARILSQLAESGEPVLYTTFVNLMVEAHFDSGFAVRDVLDSLGYGLDLKTHTIIFPEPLRSEAS